MHVHEYRPGGWTALVTDGAVALLHPAVAQDVAGELWQLTSEGKRLGGWVEYLAASGLSALPSFAMVEPHPDGLRVLVRGDIDVTVDGRVVSGRGYTTWREEILPAAEEDSESGGDYDFVLWPTEDVHAHREEQDAAAAEAAAQDGDTTPAPPTAPPSSPPGTRRRGRGARRHRRRYRGQ